MCWTARLAMCSSLARTLYNLTKQNAKCFSALSLVVSCTYDIGIIAYGMGPCSVSRPGPLPRILQSHPTSFSCWRTIKGGLVLRCRCTRTLPLPRVLSFTHPIWKNSPPKECVSAPPTRLRQSVLRQGSVCKRGKARPNCIGPKRRHR